MSFPAGGAKGAYEVGVWQELVEQGLDKKVTAISGTSVGAINAALFATVAKPEVCARVWKEEIGPIFQFNTNLLVKVLGEKGTQKVNRAYDNMRKNIQDDCKIEAKRRQCAVSDLPLDVVAKIRERCESETRKVLFLQLPKLETIVNMFSDFDVSKSFQGFLSPSHLHSRLMGKLPRVWHSGFPDVYATALKKNNSYTFSTVSFSLRGERPERRVSMICASACIPLIFGAYEIGGDIYVDGGWEAKGGDNVPLKPILANHPEIKTVIIVYLDTADDSTTKKRIARNKAAAEKVGVNVVEITPSKPIGGWSSVFNTSPKAARNLIELGREDAHNALTRLRDGENGGLSRP